MLGALAWAALGCGTAAQAPADAGTPDTGAPATFTEIYPLLWPRATKAQCDFCHSLPPNQKSNGLLSTGATQATAYAALVGVTSKSLACSGKQYVVAGKPDDSLFLTKMTTPPCGDRMPLGGDPLTAEQLSMIRSWILAGALNN